MTIKRVRLCVSPGTFKLLCQKKKAPEATEKHKRQRAAKAELTAQYEGKDGAVLESHSEKS